ncbi:conserved hypothetical Ustilaginaceae-specific protein [Sporisorium reilianum SRZ2]|uniref:Conserved hypothetical Ustilaginaceae-specific protein n=1 Tax=Sporisorium reilianum (strain SRZ2) TaxID=999809 RepID=E6ZZI3_SPORE|nr:conserved hypothetical Ustilaginaceae-specific protein [Sporisorium reilianum SRZ2]
MHRPAILLGLVWLFVSLVVASGVPYMWREEEILYNTWANEYLGGYPAHYDGVLQRNPSYKHMIVAHPELETQARDYALQPGNGPYKMQDMRGVTMAMTKIPGDQGPARSWNLRQTDQIHEDVIAFWRINRNGARLLGFDKVPVGANAVQEVKSMSEIMRGYRLHP